jgi:DNA-binding PadR family transcriptional regulator
MLSKRSPSVTDADGGSEVSASGSKRRSAIEYTILGISWKRGARTTYALMKELSNSTSTYYRSRAGTAYPVVERLVVSGLLAYQDVAGSKGERFVAITPEGVAALNDWLNPPVEFEEVAHTVDFLRLRTFYLGAATPEVRQRFFAEALSSLETQLKNLELALAEYREMGDTFSELATLGVVHETRGRISWLREIEAKAVAAPVGPPKTGTK